MRSSCGSAWRSIGDEDDQGRTVEPERGERLQERAEAGVEDPDVAVVEGREERDVVGRGEVRRVEEATQRQPRVDGGLNSRRSEARSLLGRRPVGRVRIARVEIHRLPQATSKKARSGPRLIRRRDLRHRAPLPNRAGYRKFSAEIAFLGCRAP